MAVKKAIIAITVLVLGLCIATVQNAAAGPSEPDSLPRWGIGFRGGYYGLPRFIMDRLFKRHPEVTGSIVGGEIRYHGKGGPQGVFSVGLTFDLGKAEATGLWQEKEIDTPIEASGQVSLAAATLTAYWNILPSYSLHPYFGVGIGAGFARGTYRRNGEEVNVDTFIPVPHLPIGLTLELGSHFSLGAEARIIGGFSWGGALQIRF